MARDPRRHLALALCVPVLLGLAWGVYSLWRESSGLVACRRAGTEVTVARGTTPPGRPPTLSAEREPTRSAEAALDHAGAATAERQTAPEASFAPIGEAGRGSSILQALDEADDESRYQHLLAAMGSGAEIPVERMHEVLLTDPSAKVRDLALIALTEHPDATAEQVRAVAESVLPDPSPAVRARAERVLQQMSEYERMQRESHDVQRSM
jgi:hypothetical protein